MAERIGATNRWKVVKGDTVRKIAAQAYGDSSKWYLIWRASNFASGRPNLLYKGEIAVCPELPDDIRPEYELSGEIDQKEITLAVAGQLFSGWEGVTITRSIDTCADAFALTAPFDPDRKEMREQFRPFGYQNCMLYIGKEKILMGNIEKIEPVISENDVIITVQGRSLTGFLVDCYAEATGHEFTGRTLGGIAEWFCNLYGISIETPDGDTDAIAETRIEPGQKVFEYLNQLAQGKGMLLSSDSGDNLIIRRSKPEGKSVAAIVEGESPFLGGSGSYDGTQRFSRYKVLLQQDGNPDIEGTVEDMGIPCYRPKVEVGTDVDGKDAKIAAKWRRTMALAESVGLSVSVSGWRAPGGKIWNKSDPITLKAPSLMIYRESPFTVAGVTLRIDETQGRVADLRLVLPQTYTTDMPEAYPWD